MLTKNQTIKTEITDMNNLGYGISRQDGIVIFTDGGVTGDVLEIKIIKTAKDYAVGRVERVLVPSEKRDDSLCKVSKRCGGCAFRGINREYELELKRGFVMSAFRKSRVDAVINPVLTDGVTCGYRNKVQYPVAPGGDYGYYARHTHDIIKYDACLLSDPHLEPIARYASEYIKNTGANVRHIYLRRGQMTGETMFCLVSPSDRLPEEQALISGLTGRFPEIKSIVHNINRTDGNVILGKAVRVLYGRDRIEDVLCGCRFGISSLSFYQVNRGAAELLYREAIKRASSGSPERIADLYCGAGTIGISFAKAHPGISVTGVEIIPDAVKNAAENAELNGVSNAEFICADALTAPLDGFGCVMIDPPRKGMSQELVGRLCRIKPPHIVYVSCEPATLARDAAALISAGYRMADVTPVDMFPGTGAVECVTYFVI